MAKIIALIDVFDDTDNSRVGGVKEFRQASFFEIALDGGWMVVGTKGNPFVALIVIVIVIAGSVTTQYYRAAAHHGFGFRLVPDVVVSELGMEELRGCW